MAYQYNFTRAFYANICLVMILELMNHSPSLLSNSPSEAPNSTTRKTTALETVYRSMLTWVLCVVIGDVQLL